MNQALSDYHLHSYLPHYYYVGLEHLDVDTFAVLLISVLFHRWVRMSDRRFHFRSALGGKSRINTTNYFKQSQRATW